MVIFAATGLTFELQSAVSSFNKNELFTFIYQRDKIYYHLPKFLKRNML